MSDHKKTLVRERLINTVRFFGDAFYVKSGIQSSQSLAEAIGRSTGGGIAAGVTLIVIIASFYRKSSGNDIPAEELLKRKESEEQKLIAMILPKYIFIRFLHAFKPHTHGRQSIGLSLQATGLSFVISGIASVRIAETLLGILIFIAGSILVYTINDGKAWNRFGIFSICTLTPMGIPNAIEAGYRGDFNIAGASICHLTASAIAAREYLGKIFRRIISPF